MGAARVKSDQGSQQRVTFPAAGDLLLEGMLHLPGSDDPFPAAAVCHPYPPMGGTMGNGVVVAVCRALSVRGWAALRFNFRGVGSFDRGRGAMDDVAGAVDFICAQAGVDAGRLAIVGYSFGAEVGLRHAVRDPRVGWLVGIALVREHYADPFLDADPRPKLFVAGEHDHWAPADALRTYVARLSPPKALRFVPRAGHFFAGREGEVATLVADFLAAP